MPERAADPCALYRLAPDATQADMEIGYGTRGAQLVDCDGRRRLAVDTAKAEHDLQDQWLVLVKARLRPWWRFWGR